MRFIPTRFHAPLDYIVGVVLIAAPWIFQFSDAHRGDGHLDRAGHRAHRLQPVHELRARRLEGRADGRAQPDRHRRGDVLAASPWLFGFADESANVWLRSSSSGSPRSSSASPRSSRAATATARARHADHGGRLALSARGCTYRRALARAGYDAGAAPYSSSVTCSPQRRRCRRRRPPASRGGS